MAIQKVLFASTNVFIMRSFLATEGHSDEKSRE